MRRAAIVGTVVLLLGGVAAALVVRARGTYHRMRQDAATRLQCDQSNLSSTPTPFGDRGRETVFEVSCASARAAFFGPNAGPADSRIAYYTCPRDADLLGRTFRSCAFRDGATDARIAE